MNDVTYSAREAQKARVQANDARLCEGQSISHDDRHDTTFSLSRDMVFCGVFPFIPRWKLRGDVLAAVQHRPDKDKAG